MTVVAFAAPYLLDATTRFAEAAARLPGVELALITCEPAERLPDPLRARLAAHWRIDDPLDTGQIARGVAAVSEHVGPVQRLIGVFEHLQVPLAQVREQFGIPGMDAVTARNFRDKAQMKSVLRAAGVPCARYRLAESAGAAQPRAGGGVPRRRRGLLRQRDDRRAGHLGLGLPLPADAAGGAAQPVDPVGGADAQGHRRPGVRRHPG